MLIDVVVAILSANALVIGVAKSLYPADSIEDLAEDTEDESEENNVVTPEAAACSVTLSEDIAVWLYPFVAVTETVYEVFLLLPVTVSVVPNNDALDCGLLVREYVKDVPEYESVK